MRPFLQNGTLMRIIAGLSLLFGVWWRLQMAFFTPGATRIRNMDMKSYMDWAELHCHGTAENISHALHSPGAAYIFSWAYCMRENWSDAALLLFILSCLVMAAVWKLARQFGNRTFADCCLAVSALYPPFVGMTGVFLAEIPLLFLLLLGTTLFVSLLKREQHGDNSDRIDPFNFLLATSVGLIFGFAGVVKAQALLLLALYSLFLGLRSIRQLSLRLPLMALLIGAAIPLALSAERCTRLSGGHFCLVSTSGPQNLLFAFVPNLAKVHFNSSGWTYEFGNPTEVRRGSNNNLSLPYTPWDREAILNIVRQRLEEKPMAVVQTMLTHLYHVFGGAPIWPLFMFDSVVLARTGNVYFFLVLVLPVGIALVCCMRRTKLQLPAHTVLLFLPLLTVVGTALISSGEPRYRIPFDGHSIILGVLLWGRLLQKVRQKEDV